MYRGKKGKKGKSLVFYPTNKTFLRGWGKFFLVFRNHSESLHNLQNMFALGLECLWHMYNY